MVYNYAEAGDGNYLVTGADGASLYGLSGFTEGQAREVAFHLNAAFDRGRRDVQEKLKEHLGLVV